MTSASILRRHSQTSLDDFEHIFAHLISQKQHPKDSPKDAGDDAEEHPRCQEHYRSVFIADLHLGSSASAPKKVRRFLKNITCDHLYINGDLFGCLEMGLTEPAKLIEIIAAGTFRKSEYKLLWDIIRMSNAGTRVTIIRGNHDINLQEEVITPSLSVRSDALHETSSGEYHLVAHGHEFDQLVRRRWLEVLGTRSLGLLGGLSVQLDRLQTSPLVRLLGKDPQRDLVWSLGQAVLNRFDGGDTKEFRQEILTHARSCMETLVKGATLLAHQHGNLPLAGVTISHTHVPDEEEYTLDFGPAPGRFVYRNTGHWTKPPRSAGLEDVPSQAARHPAMTFIAEHLDGRLENRRWLDDEKRSVPLKANPYQDLKEAASPNTPHSAPMLSSLALAGNKPASMLLA